MTRKWTPFGFVGVVGCDDVGMYRTGPPLAPLVETWPPPRRFGDRGGSFLIATPLHPPMLGLVDLPHAAFADLVQQGIVAQHQTFCLTVIDQVGLVDVSLF